MEPSITASWSSREKSEGEAAISPSRRSLRPGWRPVVCEGVSGEGWMCEGVSGKGYMCEDTFTQFSHNQLKIHYYTLTPHTLHSHTYAPFPVVHLQDLITLIGRVFPSYCFLLCTLPYGFLSLLTHSSHHGRLKLPLLLCTLELCEESEGRRMSE